MEYMDYEIETFILKTEHISRIEHLTDEQAGKLIKAIFHYTANGETPDFGDDVALFICYDFIISQIDAYYSNYLKTVERYRCK